MSIFKKLFTSSTRTNIDLWIERTFNEINRANSTKTDPKVIIFALINGLNSSLKLFGDSYKTDNAIFELGSYILFRGDYWLFENHPEEQTTLQTALNGEFVKAFSASFPKINCTETYFNRLDCYASLCQYGVESMHFHLHELLNKKDAFPKSYDPSWNIYGRLPLIEQGIKGIEIWAWESAILSTYLEHLDKYFNRD